MVAEGRDMGCEVFPEAPIKFYLDASLEERATRTLERAGCKGRQHNPRRGKKAGPETGSARQ